MSLGVMPQRPSVFVACFSGLPEHAALARLARDLRGQQRWRLVEDRVDLMRLAMRLHPDLVLLPSLDVAGLPHTPIIERLRHDAPDVAIAVIVRDGATALGLTEAVRAGAEILSWESPSTLSALVNRLVLARDHATPTPEVIKSLCDGFVPESCASMLFHCVNHAARHLSVDDLAADLGVSRRSLSRWLRHGNWPPPLELIEWGRLLRASLSQWMGLSGGRSLFHASGFGSPAAMKRSVDRLLAGGAGQNGDLAPLYVTTMLRRRLETVSRRGHRR